jgi:N-acetylmuramoyl-L-alanine amidase
VNPLIRWQPSPNHQERPAGIPLDMLVLHYTGMRDQDLALARLCDSEAAVSAHYLIDEQGDITQLVAEERRAWHAGQSCWRGHRDVNSRSIGIELVNPGHQFGYRPFPAVQMQALAELATTLLARWPIPAQNVVGHSDVAPLRKQDPGELFDWRWLADQGIGLWPRQGCVAGDGDAAPLLRHYGYDLVDAGDEPAVVAAFQRHFRPSCCDGRLDPETLDRLHGLIDQLR